MKKKLTEKEKLNQLYEMVDKWLNQKMYEGTFTYINWKHDKGSFAFGYIMALKAIREKIDDIRN